MENSDNVIGYIEYLSDDGKIVGYVTPFTDVDKFRKEILKAAEVGMPITPVVFPDKLDKPLGLPRDIYWPGGFRKEKRQTYPYEIYQTNNRNFVFRNYAYAKTRMKAADYKLVYSGQMERWDEPEDIYIAHNQSNRPNAQKMRSVSISDIIVIHNRSETQAFYVDEYGYRQVDYLLSARNCTLTCPMHPSAPISAARVCRLPPVKLKSVFPSGPKANWKKPATAI